MSTMGLGWTRDLKGTNPTLDSFLVWLRETAVCFEQEKGTQAKYPLRRTANSHKRSEDPKGVHVNPTGLCKFPWERIQSAYIAVDDAHCCDLGGMEMLDDQWGQEKKKRGRVEWTGLRASQARQGRQRGRWAVGRKITDLFQASIQSGFLWSGQGFCGYSKGGWRRKEPTDGTSEDP